MSERILSRYLICVLSAVMWMAPFYARSAKITFGGVSHDVIEEKPEKGSGLDAIYILFDIKETNAMLIEGFPTESLRISVYSNLGGGFAREIDYSISGNSIIVESPEAELGYILESGNERYYFWLSDYSRHPYGIKGISPADIQDCDATVFNLIGEADAIHYYSIHGRRFTLSREIELSYINQAWNSDVKAFEENNQTSSYASTSEKIAIQPALRCPSEVSVTGDRFLKIWGLEHKAFCHVSRPNGIAAETLAAAPDADTDNSNQISGVGGSSAPLEYRFQAFTTDGVAHNEWQISADPDFNNILYSFTEKEIDFDFREEGIYYVRFIASNGDGSCESICETYEINVGASELRIPNAFSPDGDGVNDIWKVGYRSLLEFKCSIFDRNGNLICHFERPDLGWDGKYKGKYVGSGVYFYVIEAIGADGKKYKKGGDINIIRSRKTDGIHRK